MLLLTRKLGERIRVSIDGIVTTITIVGVKGNHVKLGFDAPPCVQIHREEIYERIQAENRHIRESQIAPVPPFPASPGTDPSGDENPPPDAA